MCDDPIDQRHRDMLPDAVWGDGDPEGVRRRAAEAMTMTARTAARLGISTVVGFSRNPIVLGQEDIRLSRPAQNTTFPGGSRFSPEIRGEWVTPGGNRVSILTRR